MGVLPWPQTWMVQSQGIPAVEFEATCDLIFNKYDKDVSLGRWVRVGCGRMNLSGLCCLHSLLMSGSIPMWCRKKTSSTNNCVEKTKDRSISWYIYIGYVFFPLPLPANQIFTVTKPGSIWGESSNVWCHMPRFASRSLLIVVFWGFRVYWSKSGFDILQNIDIVSKKSQITTIFQNFYMSFI